MIDLTVDRRGENVFWSHRSELFTFDVMIEEFGLTSAPLRHLATIVIGADTSRPERAPEVPGCLSTGSAFSACTTTTLKLEAGVTLYDAFHR